MHTIDEVAASPMLLRHYNPGLNLDLDCMASEFLVELVHLEALKPGEAHSDALDLDFSGIYVAWPKDPALRERAQREITDGSLVLFWSDEGGAGGVKDFRVLQDSPVPDPEV